MRPTRRTGGSCDPPDTTYPFIPATRQHPTNTRLARLRPSPVFGPARGDRLVKKLILTVQGTSAAVDVEFDFVVEGFEGRSTDEMSGAVPPRTTKPDAGGSGGSWSVLMAGCVIHAASQRSMVLPARIGFPIRRRYPPVHSITGIRVLIVEDDSFRTRVHDPADLK
jgi:hypothetical protein